jgi:transcriptional regulator with XRE-family HTH domain
MRADPLPRFANNVRARRRALKLTQETAAGRVLMDTSYWSRIERGVIDPGTRMVTRIATALETTPAVLLAGVGSDASSSSSDRRDPQAPCKPAANTARDRPRDVATSSPPVPWPPPSPRLAYGSAVVYSPTNYSTSRAPARPTPTHPAIPPINLIAVLIAPTTPPASSSVPPTT